MKSSLNNQLLKYIFPLLTGFFFFLFFISCGSSDPWTIPEEYQNLSLNQLKVQSSITVTKDLLIEQGSTQYNAKVDDSHVWNAAEDKVGQLGYFEGEVDVVIQRKDDSTTYDLWFCIGKRNQKAIKVGSYTNTCANDKRIFIVYKTDRGPNDIAVGKKLRFAGIFEDKQMRVVRTATNFTNQYYPKFRLIKAEYN